MGRLKSDQGQLFYEFVRSWGRTGSDPTTVRTT